jgi:hypothetical protein
VFCGRHLLASKLRPANIDASAGSVQIPAKSPTDSEMMSPGDTR